MRFRQDLRSRLVVLCDASRPDPTLALAPAPSKPDALDRAIIRVGVQVVAGAQVGAFCLRYFGDESDPVDRLRMTTAYALYRNSGVTGNGASFDAIVRNSNRAVERLFDVLRDEVTGQRHRQTIIEGWNNAQQK